MALLFLQKSQLQFCSAASHQLQRSRTTSLPLPTQSSSRINESVLQGAWTMLQGLAPALQEL